MHSFTKKDLTELSLHTANFLLLVGISIIHPAGRDRLVRILILKLLKFGVEVWLYWSFFPQNYLIPDDESVINAFMMNRRHRRKLCMLFTVFVVDGVLRIFSATVEYWRDDQKYTLNKIKIVLGVQIGFNSLLIIITLITFYRFLRRRTSLKKKKKDADRRLRLQGIDHNRGWPENRERHDNNGEADIFAVSHLFLGLIISKVCVIAMNGATIHYLDDLSSATLVTLCKVLIILSPGLTLLGFIVPWTCRYIIYDIDAEIFRALRPLGLWSMTYYFDIQ
ncbi:hypothetical protein WICPIJ_005979 [Wickerhamomyces pijperi]|uniref:Uncharacterized protein n=1 Tax=Wickerhamomyces pijperi TaxID=599730 RepID=A0A9P8Q2I7_WICPI|nr:hypothetical protein WICPIJ_005979 [Wickerhamomyces pijperi]